MTKKRNFLQIVTILSILAFSISGVACALFSGSGGSTATPLPEGYATFSIANLSSRYSIVQITVRGGNERQFTHTYQVNLSPKGSGMFAMGGSKDIGEIVGDYRRPVVPVGVYEIALRWSNGVQTNHRETVSRPGIIANYDQ